MKRVLSILLICICGLLLLSACGTSHKYYNAEYETPKHLTTVKKNKDYHTIAYCDAEDFNEVTEYIQVSVGDAGAIELYKLDVEKYSNFRETFTNIQETPAVVFQYSLSAYEGYCWEVRANYHNITCYKFKYYNRYNNDPQVFYELLDAIKWTE